MDEPLNLPASQSSHLETKDEDTDIPRSYQAFPTSQDRIQCIQSRSQNYSVANDILNTSSSFLHLRSTGNTESSFKWHDVLETNSRGNKQDNSQLAHSRSH
ncbi:rCG24721, isoform CRA_a [Rattus norvegicus]|uniref:RCG24721, isoform CRA_a n=1 Tax=Rattus norvegicus TaxID=10116 RepID=A6JC24_RAT|nr:rCG24721, isoform CRA_a [Rattus norvegicus]